MCCASLMEATRSLHVLQKKPASGGDSGPRAGPKNTSSPSSDLFRPASRSPAATRCAREIRSLRRQATKAGNGSRTLDISDSFPMRELHLRASFSSRGLGVRCRPCARVERSLGDSIPGTLCLPLERGASAYEDILSVPSQWKLAEGRDTSNRGRDHAG